MHKFDGAATDLIFDYLRERLALKETPLDFPGETSEIKNVLNGLIKPEGNSIESVVKLYDEKISRSVISGDSPRFFAFIPVAPTKAALLFDMIVSAASLQGISWLEAAGAVAAENQVLRWMADAAGMPQSAGGTFVSGGSAANLAALTVARDMGRKKLNTAQVRPPVRIAMSKQAHSSIGNSLSILDVEPLIVETESDQFTGADLAKALAAIAPTDPPVVAVVATAGTTNAGIVDDLAGLGKVAKENDLWFHVDAAYGGAALLAPSVKHLFSGIELADSITMDPHKWWFAPFDVAAIIYRDPALAKAVHTQDASYLDVLHTSDDAWNPTDYAYHLTRRARGLPLWFSVVVNGTDAYRDAVEAAMTLTRQVTELIRADSRLELVIEPTLSVILWRRIGWTPEDYAQMQDRLLDQQIAFVTPTTWKGETVGRFAFVHPNSTLKMVQEVFEQL
jgi:glutamate/tyrosine decarboxylase-like PLP-dependent enzyme